MSDEENEIVDPEAEKLRGVPKLHIRQCELPEELFKKVQIYLKEALAGGGGGANKSAKDDGEEGGGGGGQKNTNQGKSRMEKDIARDLKEKLDQDTDFNQLPGKGPWQCIVGKSFAGAITHEASKLLN